MPRHKDNILIIGLRLQLSTSNGQRIIIMEAVYLFDMKRNCLSGVHKLFHFYTFTAQSA
jgi:hypothetical protein